MSAAITRNPIDVATLITQLADPRLGGTVAFLGSVRRGPEDGAVTVIEYSAYEDMVVAELERIVRDARAQWPDAVCAAQHRVGSVPAGEPSIAVVAAAPHRGAAFEACRFVVDEAKRRLPVWKRERFEDGTSQWREG